MGWPKGKPQPFSKSRCRAISRAKKGKKFSQEHRRSLSIAKIKHGMCGTRTYKSWSMMKERCTNPNHVAYHRYGGRGIRVCKRWSDFRNFVADMGERPEGMTLDRIDNNKGYSPSNCRWATPYQQIHNRN